MKRTIRRWLPEAIISVVILIGLFSAYVIAKKFPYGNFLYHYQTLITGVLAVGAAFITVRQMMMADIEQGNRHREALAFAMRGELLKMERGLHPSLEEVSTLCDRVSKIDFKIPPEERGSADYKWYSSVAPELLDIIAGLEAIIDREPFKTASDYFDGNLMRILIEMDQIMQCLKRNLKRHIDAQDPDDIEGWQHYDMDWDDFGEARIQQAHSFREALVLAKEGLENAAVQHEKMKGKFNP